MSERPTPKVVYIAGFSRCGSTLLGSMLGQLDGFFNLGEMRMLWHRSLTDDRACGCGKPFSRCEVWSSIMARYQAESGPIEVDQMASAGRDLTRSLALPRMFRSSARRKAVSSKPEYLSNLSVLYETVSEETSSRVLVDTSKVPMYAFALRQAGLDVTVVHLLRDPRAVAQSRVTPKRHVDTGAEMGGVSVVNSALMWNLVNSGVTRILGDRQYLQLGYREMVQDPVGTIDTIVGAVGLPKGPSLSMEGSAVVLDPTHSVFGNPGRFSNGKIEIRLDERWKSELSPTRARVVEVLTRAGRRRYGPHL